MTEYWRYRDGYRPRGNVRPSAVGAVLRDLQDAGRLSASAYVEAARPAESPVHDSLTWDDGEAAHQYRLTESRVLIRSTEMVVVAGEGPDRVRTVVFNVHVPDRLGQEGRYVASSALTTDEEAYAAALAELRVKHAAAWRAFLAVQRLGETREGGVSVLSIAAQGFAAVDKALGLLAG